MSALNNLPIDVFSNVCSFLGGIQTITRVAILSQSFNSKVFSESNDTVLWGKICAKDFGFDSLLPTSISLTSSGNPLQNNYFLKKWRGLRKWHVAPQERQELFNLSPQEARSVINFHRGYGFGIYLKNTSNNNSNDNSKDNSNNNSNDNKKLISFEYPGSWDGSLVRYFILGQKIGDSFENELAQVRYLLNGGNIDMNVPLQQQLYPFLRLLPAGEFHLALHFRPEPFTKSPPFKEYCYKDGPYNMVCSNQFSEPNIQDNFFRLDMIQREFYVIPTQDESLIKQERVEYYRNQIRNKKYPIILALYCNTDELYILDGHHKFKAYQEEVTVNPVIITIQPIFKKKKMYKKGSGDFRFYCANFCDFSDPAKIFSAHPDEEALFSSDICGHSSAEKNLPTYRRLFADFVTHFQRFPYDFQEVDDSEILTNNIYPGQNDNDDDNNNANQGNNTSNNINGDSNARFTFKPLFEEPKY